jgi:O-antigen/teichoic acid export membrane protein
MLPGGYKSKMRKLGKNIIRTISTQLTAQFFGIISGIFITRALGPEGRGIYAIYYAAIALFCTLFSFSIETALTYFVANKKISLEKLKGISLYIIGTSMLFTVITSLLFVFFGPGLLFPLEDFSVYLLVWAWACILIVNVNAVYSGFLQGMQRYDLVNRVNLFNAFLNILLFGGCFLLSRFNIMQMGIREIFAITLFVFVANLLYWHLQFRKVFSYALSLKLSFKRDIRAFFAFIGIAHLGVVINFFNGRLVLWVIAFYMDNYTIGIYSLAVGLSGMLTMVSSPVSVVLLPYLSGAEENERRDTFLKYSRINFSMVLIIAMLGLICAPFVIPLLYGKEFTASVPLFWILLAGTVLSCQTRLFATHLISINRIHINLYATIVGFIITMIGNILLIKYFGVVGATIAANLTSFSIFIFMLIFVMKNGGFSMKELFGIKKSDITTFWAQIRGKSKAS